MSEMPDEQTETPAFLDPFRQLVSVRRDVLVLSLAMFAFSLGFQMTGRFIPRYLKVLEASDFVVGLYGTLGNIIGAVYPYPGGALSDRLGSRRSLTMFGILSSLGFLVWLTAPTLGTITVAGTTVEPWLWVFVGLFLAQAWKSFGLGATFAIVKQSVPPSQLARGFASTEVFRRIAFLFGPLVAAIVLELVADFTVGFQVLLAIALAFSVLATVAQHLLYEAADEQIGDEFEGVAEIVADLRAMPAELRPLLVADTLVRFANGMVYVFFIIVVTEFLQVGLDTGPLSLGPDSFFGVLLVVEMVVALVSMPLAASLAERVGLKPVVALGFSVYALFPILLVNAPESAAILVILFAYSGLRFAGLPAHKALIVGPAEQQAGGRVSGSYYLVRNAVVIPSAALGGALYGGVSIPGLGISYAGNELLAFTLATVVGLVGTAYFLLFGREFSAYR